MKLVYAIVADAAQVAPDGKVSMLGGDFDTIHAASFPVQNYSLALIVRLDAELSECEREHRIRLALSGPFGGVEMPPVTAPFTPHVPPGHKGQQVRSTFVLNINGLMFQQQGTYRFRIEVDGKQFGDIPLHLVRLTVHGPDVLD